MAQDPDLTAPPVLPSSSAEAGKPDAINSAGPEGDYAEGDPEGIDKQYWISCIDDAERAEREWRSRARQVIQIYRNEGTPTRSGKFTSGPVTFNILFANTEVMLPAIYTKPPQPVVRSRFVKTQEPMMMQPPMPMMGMGGPPMPPGMPFNGAPPGAPVPPMPPPEMAAGIGMGGPPPVGPEAQPAPLPGMEAPPGAAPMGPGGVMPPDMMASASPLAMGAAMPPPPPMPVPPLPGVSQPAPGRPAQGDIETSAAIMEKVLEVVVDDDNSSEAIKMAVKDVLLAGRGVCRVRWRPEMVTEPVPDPVMGGPLALPDGTPQMRERKVWEEVSDEYVYWEDFLCDPVRSASDTNWIAFRHLFTKQQLEAEFSGSQQYEDLKAANRLSEIMRWTDESAAKSPVGGGSAMKTAQKMGDHIRKCMVWEIWDRNDRQIIWFIREITGLVLRVDPDSYKLKGFFPIPIPMLAVTTTDSRIPRPFYDLYARLADGLDELSKRIDALERQIKVRGAYNAANKDIADILRAEDQRMVPVDGVDMISGGLQNHIWLVPIDLWSAALDKLYMAREQKKQAIYEIMGISDIMRGATKASETATAQRIKGTMGTVRLEDQRQQAGNFVRDLMRLKAELIAQNFDATTLEAITGEEVTPEVEAILRSDFQRTCAIDIEVDSTVQIDEQAEQEAMAVTMQAMQAVMQGAMSMLQVPVFPPDMVINLSMEFLKMALHPVKYSRGVVEMINDYQEQLVQQQAMNALFPPPPMPMGPPGVTPPGVASPPGAPTATGGPPNPPNSGNGAAPPKPSGPPGGAASMQPPPGVM